MQKTETYKLNLIEMDDTFSPQPLNENAQKLEDALSGAVDALDRRVAALEAHKLVTGSYTGTGGAKTIPLGFDPVLVHVHGASTSGPFGLLAMPGVPATDHSSIALQIVPGGFTVAQHANSTDYSYYYFAVL